ncbi:MAG TPA: hypothetical protein DHM37_02045 [Candidatus Cloacimonas sp.]|jgi:outer membrane lipoprotein-sorting protein|nr:hypothetical protein [Candidatus Cloacimonas sp.]
MDLLKMMIFRITLALVMLLAVNLTATELDEVFSQLKQKYADVETYQAEFSQQNYWTEVDIHKTSNGKIFYNNDNLLLSYQQPDGQKLLIDSTKVIMYDPSAEQVLITDKIDTKLRPIEILKYYWEDAEKELVTTKNGYNILLKKAQNKFITATVKDGWLKIIRIEDNSGNWVEYSFFNEVYNKKISPQIFQIEFDDDVNIIDNRKERL